MKNPLSLLRAWFVRKFVEPRRMRLAALEMQNGLLRIATVFETLNKFRKAGILYTDFKHKAVTIEQGLAEQFLYPDHDSDPTDDRQWQNFLHNLQHWAAYEYSVSEYTRQRTKLMADAEAKAYAETKDKSTFDDSARQLIRMRTIAQFDQQVAEHPIPIPDLHFYVIGINGPLLVARWVEKEHRFVTMSVKDNKVE